MTTYYVDSTAAGGGNGTIGTPWNALASLPTLAAGDVVNLKRGSTFRETLTVSGSGASGNVITYQDYSTGAKPIIKGSDVVSSWSSATSGSSPYAGLYWQATVTTSPVMVFRGGAYLYQGSSATTLNNLEWSWTANVLTIRDDAGSTAPAGTIEATKRSNCISLATRAWITFRNLRVQHDNSIAWNMTGQTNISIQGCETVDSWQWANLNGAGPVTWSGCLFDLNRQKGTANAGLNLSAAASVHNLQYCLIRRSGQRAVKTSAAVTLTVDNCVILGNRYPGVYNTGASTGTIRNSVIGGGPVDNDEIALVWSAGTLTYSNTLIQRSATNGRTASLFTGTPTDGGGNPARRLAPKFTAERGVGILSLTYDDLNWPQAGKAGNVLRAVLGGASGIGTTCHAYTGPLWSGADITGLQAMIAAGDDVGGHTRNHFDLSTANALSALQYTGTGTAASLTVSGTPLTLATSCTGAAGDNLSIDLTTVGSLTALRTAIIAGGKYTATVNAVSGGFTGAPASYLASQTIADIKTAAVAVTLDLTQNGAVYTGEIVGCRSDLTSNLTAVGGGAYNPRSWNWPQGGNTPAAIAAAAANGWLGGRLAQVGSMKMDDLPLYQHSAQTGTVSANVVLRLIFESSGAPGTDTSALGNTFTNTGVVNTGITTGKRQQSLSGQFNGTTAFLSRSSAFVSSSLDYTGGDWLFAVYLTPTALTGTHTVWFHGTDASNYHRLYLDASGAAHYEIVAAGTQLVHVFTNNGRFVANSSTAVAVRQRAGAVELLWGSNANLYADTIDANASATTATTPANYSGTMYVGAGTNFTTQVNFYAGYMDDAILSCWTVADLHAQIEALCASGSYQCWEIHPGDADQTDLVKLIADTVAAHPLWTSGQFKLLTAGDALAYMRGQGTVTGDLLRLRWAQADAANYVPASGSPLIDAGASLGYTSDLAGTAVPQGAAPDIGAYEAPAVASLSPFGGFFSSPLVR